VLSTGADMVLGVSGGTASFNVNGGNPDSAAVWAISGLTHSHSHAGPAHTHTGPSHTHTGPYHTHTGPSHTHTGPSHTHTGPSHTHGVNLNGVGYQSNGSSAENLYGIGLPEASSGAYIFPSNTNFYTANSGTANTGADGTGATGASGTGATGAEGTGATSAAGTGATGSSGTASTGDASVTGVSSTGAWRPKASIGKLFQLDTA
jgi:hypothetical protein